MFLAESTVKSHLASSFRKLGLSSRAEVSELIRDAEATGAWDSTDEHAASLTEAGAAQAQAG
jgi:regulatory LuxR family protein